MSVIETLTEGIRQRSLAQEGEALLGKWEQTGATDEPPQWTHLFHGFRLQPR